MESPQKDVVQSKQSGASLLLDLQQLSKIFAWGEGKEGTLGHGESTNSTAPIMIGGFDTINFTSVSAGLYHSVAISVDGKLYSWGRGENGRLGHGDVLTRFRPKVIEFLQFNQDAVPIDNIKFRAVSAGYHHNVAIDSDGQLYSWGSGWSGQLGHSTTDDVKRPMMILLSTATRSTSSGSVIGARTVVSRSGVLDATAADKRRSLKESIKNDADTRFVTAAAGFHHSLAVTESGKLFSWGFGEHGQLGHGEQKRINKPRAVTGLADVTFKQVSASEYHSLALSSDGKIYSWGWGEFGELGQGQDNKQVSVPTPVTVKGTARVLFKAVAAGAYLSVALCSDGHLYTAGRQLRERSPFNYEFTKMEGAGHLRFVQVSAKNNHVLLLSEDAVIYSWGHNTVGQLGYEKDGDLIPKPVNCAHFSAPGVTVLQVSAGGNHSLALAKVPSNLSTNLAQSQASPSLSSSQALLANNSKSAPNSPSTPRSRIRSQQLVMSAINESSDSVDRPSSSRERSFTVESPPTTELESSKVKKEKKRSRSRLEDSGSRTSRPRLEHEGRKSSKQFSKGEIMTTAEIQSKITDLMARQHEIIKSEQKLLKQKEEILKKETKLKQDLADIESSFKIYMTMLNAKLNTRSDSDKS